MLEKVIAHVNRSFGAGRNEKSMAHFERALFWLDRLCTFADEDMRIAAYAHDLGRAFMHTNTVETFRNREFNDAEILEDHQKAGAKAITEFLRTKGYEGNAARVYNMVRYHEVGGNNFSDWIKDVDSISFFEVNVSKFLGFAKELGVEKVRRKFYWMYDRISNPIARKVAEPMYRRAVKMLDAV